MQQAGEGSAGAAQQGVGDAQMMSPDIGSSSGLSAIKAQGRGAGPLPAPAECFYQARRGMRPGISPTRIGQATVGTGGGSVPLWTPAEGMYP